MVFGQKNRGLAGEVVSGGAPSGLLDTSQNLSPLLAGRKVVFENRRILRYPKDRRKRLDAPDDVVLHAQIDVVLHAQIQDQGFERHPIVPWRESRP